MRVCIIFGIRYARTRYTYAVESKPQHGGVDLDSNREVPAGWRSCRCILLKLILYLVNMWLIFFVGQNM